MTYSFPVRQSRRHSFDRTFDEWPRFPITRASLYPRTEDWDAPINPLAVTCLGVIVRVTDDRVTLTASNDDPPSDSYDVEFALDAAAARGLAGQLLAAADWLG